MWTHFQLCVSLVLLVLFTVMEDKLTELMHASVKLTVTQTLVEGKAGEFELGVSWSKFFLSITHIYLVKNSTACCPPERTE